MRNAKKIRLKGVNKMKNYEDITTIINDIKVNLNDEAKVTEKLVELMDEYKQAETENNEAKTRLEAVTIDNEKLRDSNMRLFLKIGTPEETKEDKKETKLTFDDLLNENGTFKVK